MSLAVAIHMDHIASVDIAADSTFVLALEAQARGHALFHYLPRDLFLRDGRAFAHAQPLQVRDRCREHVALRPTSAAVGMPPDTRQNRTMRLTQERLL